jgi:hypothetical protein
VKRGIANNQLRKSLVLKENGINIGKPLWNSLFEATTILGIRY